MYSDNQNEVVIENENLKGTWTFIAPVSGVEISDFIGNEFKVKRTLLVSRSKLFRIRRRLGIPEKFSDLKKSKVGKVYSDILETSETFAVIRHSATKDKVVTDCRKIIQDELAILSSSQLGWSKRRSNSKITLEINKFAVNFQHIAFNTNNKKRIGYEVAEKLGNLFLSGRWNSFCKEGFFSNLLKIINKKIEVNTSWRKDIERAAILVGQSQNSNEIIHAFLWNMIALELLLTRQGDKYTDVLPKRIYALLGWWGNWAIDNYPNRINEIYNKRCAFVHDEKRENITAADLLFTDDILFNILTNLLAHTKLFKSKDDVIGFSKQVEAEQLLNIKPRVQPKTFIFFSKNYTEKDFERI